MQYVLPSVIRSRFFQPADVDLPEGGMPYHFSFRWNPLIPMDVQEITRNVVEDTVLYSRSANFTGQSSASVNVFTQIYHIHNGQQLPLFSTPSPLNIAFGTGQRPNAFSPAYLVPAGDQLMVEVRSQDRLNSLNVETVLYGTGLNGVQLNSFQKTVLDDKRRMLDSAQPEIQDLVGDKAPPGARPLVQTSSQFFPFPQPGAGPTTIFTYQVPPGQRARIFEHALVNTQGGIVDMSGNVIWRFLVDGYPLKGLGTQLAQIGTFSTPDKVVIWLTENQNFQVTVEVPATNPITNQPTAPQNGNTAYRINGYTVPLKASAGSTQ